MYQASQYQYQYRHGVDIRVDIKLTWTGHGLGQDMDLEMDGVGLAPPPLPPPQRPTRQTAPGGTARRMGYLGRSRASYVRIHCMDCMDKWILVDQSLLWVSTWLAF